MKTEPPRRPRPAGHRVGLRRALTGAALASASLLWFAGCSPKAADPPPAASQAAREVTLTAAQRQHIRLATVEPGHFRKTIETTGVVDFDNDQATSVLAPFSGPVSRLLVAAGDRVGKGQALAMVDFGRFRDRRQRLRQGARRRPDQPQARRHRQGSAGP